MGRTPLVVDFTHHGVRRVDYYLEGYQPRSLRVNVAAPWWARFPLDYVSELLLPLGWRDDHAVHAELLAGDVPLALPERRSVLERAEALRRAGPTGPRSLPPPRTEELPPPVEEAEAEPGPEPEPPAGVGVPGDRDPRDGVAAHRP